MPGGVPILLRKEATSVPEVSSRTVGRREPKCRGLDLRLEKHLTGQGGAGHPLCRAMKVEREAANPRDRR